MNTVLVTGGSKGIGLEFVKQYLSKGWRVITSSRKPENAKELLLLKSKHGIKLGVYSLDVSDINSRTNFFTDIKSEVNHIDILINNAGIKSGNERTRTIFGELDQNDLCRTYLVNSVGPLLITEGIAELLKNGENPLIVNITSINGSISNKDRIGGWGYSASKAALNMITKMLSVELNQYGIKVISIHPGWVKTPMTIDENAPLEPAESISGMISVITNLSKDDTGKFFDWKGNKIAW